MRQLIFLAAALPFSTMPALAVDCSLPFSGLNASQGDVFNITAAGFSAADIQTAAGYWACSAYSGKISTFQIGGSGGVPVLVGRFDGNAPVNNEGCGLFIPENPAGYIESAEIRVWAHTSSGGPCPVLTDVLAHEFGHLLGLANAPDLACSGHIMGRSFGGDSLRTVAADDCEVADQMWITLPESNPLPDPFCDAYCWSSCVNNACPPRPPGQGCPILIDLENDGIHLTGLDDPVWFDIDADGAPDLMSWTDRGEGLLALDRDGNGAIDSGGELFGNYTRLADGSRALNGYLALAELDTWIFGGNGDGFIDAADQAFDSLLMWTDRNHDGTSQPDELTTLQEAGIQRFALDYRRSNRTDRYGNTFRFLGRAWKQGRNGAPHPVLTWDVFFVVAP